MKAWILPLLAILLAIATGTTIGTTTSILKYQEPVLVLAGHVAKTEGDLPEPVAYASPKVFILTPTNYDFGIMARNDEKSHTFKIKNIGTGELTLKVINTTCKCTVGTLGQDAIPEGEEVDVTLTWQALSYDREFYQSATIETNDQTHREIIFTIEGQVIQLALPYPPSVTFSRLSRSEPRQFEVKIYGYRDEDLRIDGHQFSDLSTKDFFDVQTEPLPRDEWEDPQAISGIRVTVSIKPGLPLGVVQQVIGMFTNKRDIAPLEIAIDMTIVSDISVLGGRNFNDETNVLRLGPVLKANGKTAKLYLMVKGRHRDKVSFSLAEIDPPDALEAELGEPREISNGVVLMVPLTITVPKGSPSVHRMGSKQGSVGKIVLNTQHPEIEQLEIKVVFVVQD